MNDPWHQDTLEGLIAAIEAAKLAGGTAYAVVVVSSERLGGEVVGELGVRLEQADVLRACTYVDPRSALQRRLDEPQREGFRTTVIQGLPALLESERGKGLLGWLNFRRESFSRADEAFVFVLTRETADRWAKEAPDLDRYTAHFDFEDWDDLVEAAERAAAQTELVGEDGETRLRRARERLQQARKLGGDIAVGALLEVAEVERRAGLHADAERSLAEASSLAHGVHEGLRGKATLQRAYLLVEQGHPDVALQALRSVDRTSLDEALLAAAFGSVYTELGKDTEALAWLHRHPGPAGGDGGWALSRLLDLGEVRDFLIQTTKQAREAAYERVDSTLVRLMTLLAIASLRAARPHRSAEILDEVHRIPGSQCASIRDITAARGESYWVLGGPDAVAAIIYEEEQRQRGWTAPIPAAELAYVRGLAATDDATARHHFQDAANRFRVMDGDFDEGRFLNKVERWLARLDRLHGDLDRATARTEEHFAEGYRPLEARDRTELAMIALGRREPKTARDHALQALELIRACGTRLYEPAALVALAAAERALGSADAAELHDRRWRRLVRGIDAKGLEAALERDAAWAAAQAGG